MCTEGKAIIGCPQDDRICTSHNERMNLTVRMTLRRFTRLTNAHSKSVAHHTATRAICVAFYDFARPHETLKRWTPAMAAGLTDKTWKITELLDIAAGC